jgi:hypothetical protein
MAAQTLPGDFPKLTLKTTVLTTQPCDYDDDDAIDFDTY